ncbi:MAG: protease [candidate division Zixibacteria bacterium]|nr:protease [candidate division Zixibacteria bacterium]
MAKIIKLSFFVIILLYLVNTAGAEDRLFRFPDVSSDKIVFSYAGDLWLVPIEGGQARQLTGDKGLEIFARFSPDGGRIAFTGQYDGNTHVYVIPVEGGEPKRLTYHPAIARTSERMGPEHIVMDWSLDGKDILFRSRRQVSDVWSGKLMLVSIEGGLPRELPVPKGGFASFSPDQSKIAYCPKYRDFRTWKRYKGGMAQDVYIYDLQTYDRKKLTDWIGTDNMPMWLGDKIYFNSDRTGRLNLYSYNPESEEIVQVTDFTDYDVRWPSMGPDHIVFENGGYVYLYDVNTGQSRKIDIEVGSDKTEVRPEYLNVRDNIVDYSLSPDGKRVVIGARGDIFTVPAEHGDIRNLTQTNGINEKYAVWSPDGNNIACVSDKTGEEEIYILSREDDWREIQLTTTGNNWRFQPRWSPDSKKLAFSDSETGLHILDVNNREITTVDETFKDRIGHYRWSPDSRWLTYVKHPDKTRIRSIFLYSLEDNQIYRLTDGTTDDYNPVFDPDGNYIYFISKRSFNATTGDYEFDFVYNHMDGIYAILLDKDKPSPFAPRSDEVGEKEYDDDDDEDDWDYKAPNKIKIDLDGIMYRQVSIPIDPGSYSNLKAVPGRLFYYYNPYRGLSGKKDDSDRRLMVFDMEEREEKVFLENLSGYNFSADYEKILIRDGNKYFINKASADKGDKSRGVLDLDGLEMYLDRKAEYAQIFDECWRRMRDMFYDPNMHGVDWQAMHDLYAELVPHASHRFDLIYIIGELIGEVACSHTYVGGGDYNRPSSDQVALLGAVIEADSSAGLYRIGRIFNSVNWDKRLRCPLTEPGVGIEEGEYLFAIDGENLDVSINPYKLLVNKADRMVTLTVGKTPDRDRARNVKIDPIDNEAGLWYHDWVERRREIVDSLSEGKIGYIHIPDMGGFGLNMFAKQFYYLYKKQGLILDVRYNGGGFVSQLVLDRLRRVVAGMGAGRFDWVGTYPSVAFHGHMACLLNEFSCSDGDIFPYYFREYGLGPLIGKRSWGGVIGIGGFRPLTDGGYLFVPGGGSFSLEGDWTMENVGVYPDIEIEQDPKLVMQGRDPQLEKAIEYLLEKIKTEPKTLPDKPGPPEQRNR